MFDQKKCTDSNAASSPAIIVHECTHKNMQTKEKQEKNGKLVTQKNANWTKSIRMERSQVCATLPSEC